MRRIWLLSLFTLGSLTTLSTSGLFAGDDAANLRCEPKSPPFECGTPIPTPTPSPTPDPKPTPVVRDHRTPKPGPIVRDHRKPVVTSGPIIRDHRDHRDPVVVTGPIVRDHRTPVVVTGPTVRDHRTPTYTVPAPTYVPRPKLPRDTSQASGGVVVSTTPKTKSPRP